MFVEDVAVFSKHRRHTFESVWMIHRRKESIIYFFRTLTYLQVEDKSLLQPTTDIIRILIGLEARLDWPFVHQSSTGRQASMLATLVL